MIYCQTDYNELSGNNALKTTAMENNYFQGLNNTYNLAGTTSICLLFSCIFLIIYVIRICREKKIDADEKNIKNVNVKNDIVIIQDNNYDNNDATNNNHNTFHQYGYVNKPYINDDKSGSNRNKFDDQSKRSLDVKEINVK